jgi:hypothetical protein
MRNRRSYAGIYAAIILLTVICAAVPARADVQYTIPQTVDAVLATNLACTGAAQTFVTGGSIAAFKNLGQTQHYATAISSGTATSFQFEIDGIDSSGNVQRISDTGLIAITGATTIAASGRFSKIQVQVTCAPISATFTLTYSGTSATTNVTAGTYLLGQINKSLFNIVSASAGQVISFQSPYGSSAGLLLFKYNVSSVANSTVAIACSSTGAFPTYQTFVFTPVANTTAQSFLVPAAACPIMQVSYASGGAGSTFNLEYLFFPPGTASPTNTTSGTALASGSAPTNNALITEKGGRWSVVSAPAVSTQASASQAAGAAGVRHVADCISISAGAATAPTAAILTINLRDGATGAGSILWSTQITAAATAANHGNVSFCGINRIGTPATAMTLEFSALLTNENESVTLTGYDVN